MKNLRVPLIAGNWKMNLDHLRAIANVQKLSWTLADAEHNYDDVEVAVFPPFTDLRSVQNLISADKHPVVLGAQDLSPHDSGAYTGDISGQFLAKLDVKYVLTGHSERREGHKETEETVAQKTVAAIRHGLVPVVCVGETAADLEESGPAAKALQQLKTVLKDLSAGADFVVAYEPVWAIGSGKAATPEQAEEVSAKIRALINDELGSEASEKTRILYGGSVTSGNVAGFLKQKNVDGVLVGGASLKPEEFAKICQFKKHVTV